MELLKIAGVSRGSEFSPNHVDNDAAIFNKVVEVLQRLGCEVQTYTEKEFIAAEVTASVIFDMARDKTTIAKLKEMEKAGALVVNSAFGIDNCVRRPMTEKLIDGGIPHPKSYIVSTVEASFPDNFYPCWIKRGDSHAMVKEDVCYVTNKSEAEGVLTDFRTRNIPTAVINEHLRGDLIKFYGVQNTGFFYWFYPSPCSHSKFGLEAINGMAKGIHFSEEKLKQHCEQASVALNVPVYGGDCVVSADGKIKIIDFNDWPSFARCREEAGENIAAYIFTQAKNKMNR